LKTKETIPIEFIEIEPGNFHLFISIKVGSKKARLLLDTGASKTAFDQQKVLKFVSGDLVVKQDMNSIGLGSNEVETHLSLLPSIKLGKIKLSKYEVAVLDLNHVNMAYKTLGFKKIDGVLGSDLLHRFEAIINYKKAQLSLTVKR